MSETNNFKKLQEEDERIFGAQHDEHIRSSLWGSLSFFRFIGHLVDMFIPKVFDYFISTAKGNTSSSSRRMPEPPSQGPSTKIGDVSPGSPDDGESPRVGL